MVDASAVVAALLDRGDEGDWARGELGSGDVVAPHVMPAEVANVLRKSVGAALISADTASLAHAELVRLPIAMVAYEPVSRRAWELRANLSPYDAWYVALAESLNAPLTTLDRRLARSSGPRCEFRVPPEEHTIQTGME